MGQYTLWLHYREIDQQLHAQLAQLTSDLDALKKQTTELKADISLSDNPILQALLSQATPPTPSLNTPDVRDTNAVVQPHTKSELEESIPQNTEESRIIVSPALHAWTSLPNFNSQHLPIPPMPSPSEKSNEIVPAITSHPELDLLPQDLTAFVDEHTHTSPLHILPWWLRNTPYADKQEGYLIDQQSLRTNHLVERWLERWGRRETEQEGQK